MLEGILFDFCLNLNRKSNETKKLGNSDLAKNIMKDHYILNLMTLKENYIETELESAMLGKI
ncbi:DUF1016 family protein [bacterium]|nr:DUF1016 family protein [bacterium]